MTDPASFPETSPRHGLPLLFSGQIQKEFTVNEALARIDMLLHPVIVGESAAEPAEPFPGDCFLVAPGGSGAFSGQDGKLAGWDGQQWTFVEPSQGMVVHDVAAGQTVRFVNGWQRLSAPASPAGGATVDTEARAAIGDLIATLRASGIFL